MKILLPALLTALFLWWNGPAAARPNVLFISADDLRVEPHALTPNLDRLASQSRLFTNAHCQQAVCNPSRASIFTGLRPDTLKIWNLGTHFRETTPDAITLPQHFKNHGYTTIGIGKNFHNWKQPIQGDPASWSQPETFHWGNHGDDKAVVAGNLPQNLSTDPACECRDVADEAYIDGRIAARAVEQLRELKKSGKPFFLAAGFWKPHKPYNAPKKYWDLYQREKITMPDPTGWPAGTDRVAWHGSNEMLGWSGKPRNLTESSIREIRHGYLAATSYLDAQIGRVLDELDTLGLRENTIVVFWSDHGFHLGEHTLWAKTSNFDLDTRVPFLISPPGLQQPGKSATAPVELLDIFPTLNELCALPAIPTLEGLPLRPLLDNPAASIKPAALSQFPRPAYYKNRPEFMGYTACTATHRYTEWREWTSGKIVSRELYAHSQDPKETRNLANKPDMKSLILRLAALLPVAVAHPVAAASPPPPGITIHHSPAASGLYIGSPSLCIAPNGDYLASHDLFGPKSGEHVRARGRLYRSTDKGLTWKHVSDFDRFFWTGLFVHQEAIYLMGTDKHHGNVVIRRSRDNGSTWTPPAIIAEGQFHTAPMPAIEHDGRVWRAIEDAHTSQKWGERYRARMMSAPSAFDLLDPKSWTISNALARDKNWLGGNFSAWLEGNAVAGPDGKIVNILRVDHTKLPEKAAIVRISKDGTTATFDPDQDLIDFPGGAKKFTIRKDPAGPGYWSLASIIPERHASAEHPASIRNTLALVHSNDLRKWEIRSVLLHHPDTVNHGFQYVDWQFDGDDLIAACRTAWDDDQGGARNNHDANFLTFHRWKSFRCLTRKDDVPMPEFIPITHETTKLTITGSSFQIAPLKDGENAFSNRSYKWRGIPDSLSKMSFTRLPGGAKPILEITATVDTNLWIATAPDQDPIDVSGWKAVGQEFHYDDPAKTRVRVYTRELKKSKTLRLPSGNWTGAMLIFD